MLAIAYTAFLLTLSAGLLAFYSTGLQFSLGCYLNYAEHFDKHYFRATRGKERLGKEGKLAGDDAKSLLLVTHADPTVNETSFDSLTRVIRVIGTATATLTVHVDQPEVDVISSGGTRPTMNKPLFDLMYDVSIQGRQTRAAVYFLIVSIVFQLAATSLTILPI